MELSSRQDLLIEPGWMNAAGSLGYAPPSSWPLPTRPVAFVTQPVSDQARKPAQDRGVIPFPGGFLLHSGLPNPGLRTVVKEYSSRWARSEIPVWVHVLAESPERLDRMVRRLEETEGVAAIELSLPPQVKNGDALKLVTAALGELPLVLSVPLDRSRESWVQEAVRSGIAAITLTAPRGILAGKDGRRVRGRLIGPALLGLGLEALDHLKDSGVPLILGCGIFDPAGLEQAIRQGAAAVQLDAVLWTGWPG